MAHVGGCVWAHRVQGTIRGLDERAAASYLGARCARRLLVTGKHALVCHGVAQLHLELSRQHGTTTQNLAGQPQILLGTLHRYYLYTVLRSEDLISWCLAFHAVYGATGVAEFREAFIQTYDVALDRTLPGVICILCTYSLHLGVDLKVHPSGPSFLYSLWRQDHGRS